MKWYTAAASLTVGLLIPVCAFSPVAATEQLPKKLTEAFDASTRIGTSENNSSLRTVHDKNQTRAQIPFNLSRLLDQIERHRDFLQTYALSEAHRLSAGAPVRWDKATTQFNLRNRQLAVTLHGKVKTPTKILRDKSTNLTLYLQPDRHFNFRLTGYRLKINRCGFICRRKAKRVKNNSNSS